MPNSRPWPAPEQPPVMRMSWCELLFAHWPCSPELLRTHLPAGLELDVHDGRAWLGVVPFRMVGVRHRNLPDLGLASEFLELNLRTYVRDGSKPGVWFFSLDAQSALAVAGARALFHLPYFTARMSAARTPSGIAYSSERNQPGAPQAVFRARYAAAGPVFRAAPGTLEHFLTERYCLYALDAGGRVLRGEVDHEPWPLQPAHALIERETLSQAAGLERANGAPLLHYAERIDVRAWSPQPV